MDRKRLKKLLAGIGIAGLVAGTGISGVVSRTAEADERNCPAKGMKTSCSGGEKAKSSCSAHDGGKSSCGKSDGGSSCVKGSCR